MVSNVTLHPYTERGVRDIKLLLRGARKVKNFDLYLPWFGDDRWAKRREFETASTPAKLRAIADARQGGSITPELDAKMRALEAEGICHVVEYTQVRSAAWVGPDDEAAGGGDRSGGVGTELEEAADTQFYLELGADEGKGAGGGYWEISLDDDTDCRAEKIWLATGSRQDIGRAMQVV